MQVTTEASFDLLDLHALDPERYPFLLESSAHGPQGRFDILFAFPGETIVLNELRAFDFLQQLDTRWEAEAKGAGSPGSLPFHGGWFLFLGYELAAQIEPQLDLPEDSSALPVASATRIPAAIIHDQQNGERWIIAEQQSYISQVREDIRRLEAHKPEILTVSCDSYEDPVQPYLDAVERILDYIREGDVFQVNLSRQWSGDWPQDVSSHVLYRQLRAANPGPFNGLATWGDVAVLSSSPERLVETRGDRVQTRPIAGTRPRGDKTDIDRSFSEELMEHPKERAEHIMLIDLERNDVGRIAIPGSVNVSELMSLESYATVHHIVSNVEARIRPGVTPAQIISALFPGGTITGCPKVRCMEIIAELEGTGRGAYTGSMGYLNHDGSMDLNILIRTLVRSDDQLRFRAGAGIVSDSVPANELEETRAKARGMLSAIKGKVT
ncbi:MAG: aminodeoxychorismate synthase component I [Gammaproteobacteria bacterium]|nr:MAG: aminodeoxychorismate synthase component I [Gammaproteobacteria bacterium]